VNKLKLTLEWENNNKFEVTAKLNSDPDTTILEMHENGIISKLWSGATSIVITYLSEQLNRIGKEMAT